MIDVPATYLDWFMDQPWRTQTPLVMLYVLENEAAIEAELKNKRGNLTMPKHVVRSGSERERADQLGTNCMWLIGQIDRIHAALCPDKNGTWQDRVSQAVAAAEDIAKERIKANGH